MDGRAHQALAADLEGRPPAEADLERITLLLNQQGHPLLACKQGGADAHGRAVLPLTKGSASLLDLTVTGERGAPGSCLHGALAAGFMLWGACWHRRRLSRVGSSKCSFAYRPPPLSGNY